MAPLERVTHPRCVVGPRPSVCDRSAGDSSPVTPRSGRLRGRPAPTASGPSARTPAPSVLPTRRYPPAPHTGADAALTSVLPEGPRGHCPRGPSSARVPAWSRGKREGVTRSRKVTHLTPRTGYRGTTIPRGHRSCMRNNGHVRAPRAGPRGNQEAAALGGGCSGLRPAGARRAGRVPPGPRAAAQTSCGFFSPASAGRGGTAGIPRKGRRRAPKASAGTAGRSGRTGASRT